MRIVGAEVTSLSSSQPLSQPASFVAVKLVKKNGEWDVELLSLSGAI